MARNTFTDEQLAHLRKDKPGLAKFLESLRDQNLPLSTGGPVAGAIHGRSSDYVNPDGAPNPGGMGASVDEEIKKIENIMRTKRSTYNRDTMMQQRYRDLLSIKHKVKS